MATKKQKREAAEAKRAAFEESVRLSGLAAQAADRKRREALAEKSKKTTNEINQRHRAIVKQAIIDDPALRSEIEQLEDESLMAIVKEVVVEEEFAKAREEAKLHSTAWEGVLTSPLSKLGLADRLMIDATTQMELDAAIKAAEEGRRVPLARYEDGQFGGERTVLGEAELQIQNDEILLSARLADDGSLFPPLKPGDISIR